MRRFQRQLPRAEELNKQDNQAARPYTGVTVEGEPLTNAAKE